MSCSAIGATPIYIALIRNFTVVMNTTNIARRKLYQEGNYTCVATSKYGTDVKHFVIKGGEKIRYFETNPMHHAEFFCQITENNFPPIMHHVSALPILSSLP